MRAFPLAFLLPALFAATPAKAADWWLVGVMPDRVLIVDADSIVRDGTERVVTNRVFPRPLPDRSIVGSQAEIDCSTGRHRFLTTTAWDDRLKVESDGPAAPQFRQWLPPDPNSSAMVRFVCEGRDGATRIGALSWRRGDRAQLYRLLDAGVPARLAAPLVLGRLPRQEAERLLDAAPPEIVAILRANRLPRD